MKVKKSFALGLFIMIIMIALPAHAKNFTDVPSWAEKEINYLAEKGVVQGISNDKFGANQNIQRGDAALMLARAKALNMNNPPSQSQFPDVKKSDYYFSAIEAAVNKKYLNGYPEGDFGPKDPLTREQMAKIITDAYSLSKSGTNPFVDINKSWAKNEIIHLAYHGISNGNPNGEFSPQTNISRAEFSVMIARAMNDDFKIDVVEPPEIGSPPPEIGTPPPKPKPELTAAEQMIELVNIERKGRGIYPYKKDSRLMQSAHFKAKDMHDYNYFDHTSPKYGKFSNIIKRYNVSYTKAAENIAKGSKDPQLIFNGFMNSSGHKKNMMSKEYTHIGVGLEGVYWAQHFIKK